MAPHAGGPAPHYHKTFSESFYILDGVVRLGDGETWREATAGDYFYVPEHGIHAFSNDTPRYASNTAAVAIVVDVVEEGVVGTEDVVVAIEVEVPCVPVSAEP